MQELAARLREEVEERASLGASLLRPAATPTITTQLSAFEVPLVGRQEEFRVLVSEYHSACEEGESRVVAVLGEAGIGKTRLGEEFLLWARARGADVLKGAASEGAGLPYGSLIEAITPRMERERAPRTCSRIHGSPSSVGCCRSSRTGTPTFPPRPPGKGRRPRGRSSRLSQGVWRR
jgi:hypothetical protein